MKELCEPENEEGFTEFKPFLERMCAAEQKICPVFSYLYCTVQYSTLLYCAVLQYSTVQYSTVLYNTVLHSTVLYSTTRQCCIPAQYSPWGHLAAEIDGCRQFLCPLSSA